MTWANPMTWTYPNGPARAVRPVRPTTPEVSFELAVDDDEDADIDFQMSQWRLDNGWDALVDRSLAKRDEARARGEIARLVVEDEAHQFFVEVAGGSQAVDPTLMSSTTPTRAS